MKVNSAIQSLQKESFAHIEGLCIKAAYSMLFIYVY